MTIFSDISSIREDPRFEAVRIETKPNVGVEVICEELRARNILIDILKEYIENLNMLGAFQQMLIDEIESDVSLQNVKVSIRKAEELTNCSLTGEWVFTNSIDYFRFCK